jgi:MoaA/NifB/PqqE/SkfB family radical SAM enzyme
MGIITKIKNKIYYIILYQNYLCYLQNFTLKKSLNIIRNSIEYKLKKTKLKSMPVAYGIDICNVCNLKCPLCPTGTDCTKRKKQIMTFENYKIIFDKIKNYAFTVNLYNWGEPFLNKDFIKILEYSKKNKTGVLLSTNLNFMKDEIIDSMIKLKLDKIVVSLDGASQETYEKYRRGGDFERVVLNLKKL